MKRISLLRHAEAVDAGPQMQDLDRPLTPRGRDDARAIGAVIAKREPLPDVVLCSPSVRTRETLDCAAPPESPEILFNPAIYHAPAKQIFAAVKALPDTFEHVLVIGHNPGFHDLALKLVAPDAGDADALRQLMKKFPKGALAFFEVDVDSWREAGFGGARLRDFVRPKELRRR